MKKIVVLLQAFLLISCASTGSLDRINQIELNLSYTDSINVALVGTRSLRQASQLLHAKDTTEFQTRLQKSQRSFSKPSWNEMIARLDTIESNHLCRTSLLTPKGERDIRIDEFVRNGFPDGEWILPGEDAHGRRKTFFLYSWGEKVSMLSGDAYPVEVCPPPITNVGLSGNLPTDFSKLDLRVKTGVSLENSRSFETTVFAEVGLDRINFKTFRSGKMKFEFEVRDSTEKVIREIKHFIPLDAYLLIAANATNRYDFFVLDHADLNLKPGRYEVKVRAIGEGDCEGIQTINIKVPRRVRNGVDASDLLFVDPNPPTGRLNNLFNRWGRDDLWAPSTFKSGASNTAVVEVEAERSGAYFLSVALSATEQEGDSSTHPIYSGLHELGEKEKTLIEFPVSFDVPAGTYWLVVSLSEPTSRSIVRSVSISKVEVRGEKTPTEILPVEIATLETGGEINSSAAATASDSIPTSELRQILGIIAPKFEKKLRNTPESAFLAYVDTFKVKMGLASKPDDAKAWWNEIVKRWEWCKSRLPKNDIRRNFIMLLGVDFEELHAKSDDETSLASKVWIYSWGSRRTFQFLSDKSGTVAVKSRLLDEGSELATIKDPFEEKKSRPDRETDAKKGAADAKGLAEANKILEGEPKFVAYPDVNEPLKSIPPIYSCQLPTDEYQSRFEVWAEIGTNLSRFSDSALVIDTLVAKIALYRSGVNLVGEAAETLSILGQKFRELSLLDKGKLRQMIVPIYIGVKLDEGVYVSVLSLSADRGRNLGVHVDTLVIHPPTMSWLEFDSSLWGTGDILIPIRGSEVWNYGIWVGGEFVADNPNPVFRMKDSLPIVMQAQVPPGSEYLIEAVLTKMPEEENLFRKTSENVHVAEGKTVFSKRFRSGESGREVFKTDLPLSGFEAPGRYAVTVTVSDPVAPERTRVLQWGISHRFFKIIE